MKMIETDRLVLRDYLKNDFETKVHLYSSLSDYTQYDVWGPCSEDETRKFMADCIKKSQKNPRHEFELALCLKQRDLLIEGCSIRRDTESSRVANLGCANDETLPTTNNPNNNFFIIIPLNLLRLLNYLYI